MAMDVKNFITWIRSFLDDVYAPKGQSGITLNDVYPVGSIYMSVNNVNPSTLFGGSWTKIEGKFLLSSGRLQIASSTWIEFNNGDTGGEWAHTLTTDEMPSHTHIQDAHNHTQNSHSHRLNNSAIVYNGSASGQIPNGSAKKYTTNSGNNVGTDGATATNQPQTATNQNTGGGQPHNNMPPYLAVNVWKRVASISDITGIYLKDVDNKFNHDCPHTVTYNSRSGFTQIRINEGNTSNTGSRYYMSIPFSAQPNNVTVSVDFYTTGMSNDDFGVRICDKKTMDSSGAYDSYGAWIITGQGRLAYGYGGRETANVKYGDYLGNVTNNIQYNYTMKISKNTAYYCLKRLDTGATISEKTYTRTDTYQFSGQYYLYIGGGKFSSGSADKSVYIKNLIIG